jgi:hypothetical protein
MDLQIKVYKEWIDDTASSVVFLTIRENKVTIHWTNRGRLCYGIANSVGGVHYAGVYAEQGVDDPDCGDFEFALYKAESGERLLLGRWWSHVWEWEKEFLLIAEPS